MKANGKKLVALFLIFSLLTLFGNLFAKGRKHGAELIIQKKDGQQIRGELVAAKENSLLLMDSDGTDAAIYFSDINKKKKFAIYITSRSIGTVS